MSFKQWILSLDNPPKSGQWGVAHIITLVLCIALIVTLALVFRNKSEKARRIVIYVLAGIILFFELSRRIINFTKMGIGYDTFNFHNFIYALLPRPWCAIACWTLMISVLVNKKFFYNFACFTALLCAIIFFSYPGAGFNSKYIQFENLYSITTHSLLLVMSITLITLRFTKFEYKHIWKEMICLGVLLIYSLLEIFVLKISSDPMNFMPNNDVQNIVGISYALFLPLYILVVAVYINVFYLIDDRSIYKKHKNVLKKK